MSAAQQQATRSRRDGAPAGERRTAGTSRMPFEALVEVGAESVGGFEAESVDLSPEGIRLRTAYLPKPGDMLVCRFDGFGGEVVAEGQVTWCKAESRGGEFGVKFTHLDEYAVQVLESMCASEEDEPGAEPAPGSDGTVPGTRVRVHIQGLGSPMRARVRDVASGEVLIGSNLEFLRVGRDVELEDVERGASKKALIEHVDVSIDPETNIPQLIVALRYDEPLHDAPPDSADLVTAPLRVAKRSAAPAAPAPEREITPGPTVIDRSADAPSGPAYADDARDDCTPYPPSEGYDPEPTPLSVGAAGPVHEAEPPADEQAELEGEPGETEPAGRASAHLQGAKKRAAQLARKVTPALSAAGAGARSALGGILAKVRDKRRERQQHRRGAAKAKPLRTTAPPPSGALRSDGKRLFRESNPSPQLAEQPAAKPTDRKRAVFGAVLGVLAVVAIYGVATKVSAWQQGQSPPALAKPAEVEAAPPAAVQPAAPTGSDGSAVATAEVPLFGDTPLSTTEPVPVPPNVDLGAEGEGGADDAKADDGKKPTLLEKEWGVGTISNPTVLKLKMDGPIEGIAGAEGATGFTLVIPNRKSVSSAAGLARKDKRIESVNVVNYPDRAEVTVLFRKDVPAFLAKADGNRLVIEVGSDESAKSSKKKSKRSRSTKKTKSSSSKKKK